MKTLLFVPGYYYNSIETFASISAHLDKNIFNKIFLDMDDPAFRVANLKYANIEFVNSIFDSSYFLSHYSRCDKKIQKITNFIIYLNKLKAIISTHNPDAIVITNDRSVTFPLLKKVAHNIPIILLQTSLVNVDYYS